MNLYKTGISGTTIGLVVVLVIVVVAAGAYVAMNGSGGTTTVTQTSTTVSTASSSYYGAATVNGAGSTLVFPIMSAWTFAYSQVQPNIQVNYASIGSGNGIAQITAGTVNFGASDAPLTSAQYKALPSGSTLLTIPESDSGVVPAYNLPGVTAHLNFTGNVLANIFLGNIKMWNDSAIKALNPKVNLPAQAIAVVHRSDGSGTMFTFTNYLSDSNAQWKSQVGTGTLPKWPVGGCIANTQYSIGPLEIAYEITNSGAINYGAVQNHYGNFILANLTNIAEAVNVGVSTGTVPAGNAVWTTFSIVNNIYNSTEKYLYPITTFTYLLVYQNLSASSAGTSQAQAVATVSFINWVLTSGQTAGVKIGYPALPASVIAIDHTTLASITYNGTPVLAGS
jgi:phosphate ABC transporter phosphate-binding protein